jgi:23S rRNA (cytidine1920-2'-O)/16S rRNA (cytidine1409-2'-O)-methyltransferase
MRRRRLDSEIVRRKLAGSKQEAAALVAAGRVTVGGAPAANARRFVGPDEPVVILDEPPRFVTRAGAKLAAGLERFKLSTEGVRALDAGASGGGFTDCLLKHGARQVVAVDVGYGQLHEKLRSDPRVEVRERVNARSLTSGVVDPPADLVVADVSFISLRTVLPALLTSAVPSADLVVLVKPQFEAGRAVAARAGGVLRDPADRAEALAAVGAAFEAAGATIMDAMVSPLRGADGNVEFLLHAVAPPGPASPPKRVDLRALALATEP